MISATRTAYAGPQYRWSRRAATPRQRRSCVLLRAAASEATGPKVVVVGGGWAGFGAAKHLSEQGYAVTLLDAAPNPGGLATGWRTAKGRAVEAGMKGFWYQYHNTFALLRELGGEWPLTDFTTSGFWAPRGLVTEAPVFSRLARLPTMLGQFVHTFPLAWDLPLQERVTMLPFLLSFLDYDSDPETYLRYDRMSARELCRQWGVSERMYEEFLKPTLLVGLFAPPEEISAAVMLETLYFYALAHQNDFDVCWPRGSISERVFEPLVERIRAAGSAVLGDRLVCGLVAGPDGGVAQVLANNRETGEQEAYDADAVVFAVGVTGMQKLVTSCPLLAAQQEFRAVMNLRAIDVLAARLWFDKKVKTRFPANVLSGFEPGAGGTFFDLNELQDEYRDEPGSVITADFYHAAALLPLPDEELVRRIHAHISSCEPGFRDAKVTDYAVLRFPKAVTHFSPGSYPNRPFQTCSIPNVFLAGDWVKGVPHGANGLSQERAYVTGLTAANLVVDRCGAGTRAVVLDVEPDEAHVALGRQAVRAGKDLLAGLGLRSPFL